MSEIQLNSVIFITILLYVIYRYLTKNFNYWKDQSIPFVKPLPIFGNFLSVVTFQKDIGHFLADLYVKINKPYFGIFVLGKPTLIVTCPDLIKSVLQSDFEYFSNRTVHCSEDSSQIESNMLFFQRGNAWKDARKKLTGAFTSGKLRSMVPLISDCANQMVHYLSSQKRDLEMKMLCTKFTTAVIASCAFGLETKCFNDQEENGFLDASYQMFKLDFSNAIRSVSYFFLPSLVDTFKFSFIKPEVSNFLKDAFTQTLKLREASKTPRHDLVDILLQIKEDYKIENKKADFDDIKIISQAMQFYLAGFETSSSTMAFTLYELCLNQSIQAKLRKEILDVTKNGQDITYDNIMDMKYLHQCISETLRKYPVLPFLDRRCVRDYTIPDGTGKVIKCGTPIYIPMFGLHYDPKYFHDPQRYDPERFRPACEDLQQRHPFSYLPFGQGPHNCIGERFGLISSKLGLIYVLMNYEVHRNEATPDPIIFDTKSFVLQSTVGLPITLIKY